MVKEDIIRGLEGAMSRGESLEKAMYSFYNAGYKKEEVEDAARALSLHLSQQESMIPRAFNILSGMIPKPAPPKTISRKPEPVSASVVKAPPQPVQIKPSVPAVPKPTLTPVKKVQEAMAESPNLGKKPNFTQDVSKYEPSQKTSPKTILIIILSVLLANLLTALAGIFIFREALLDFFSNFFSSIVPAA